MGVNQGQGSRKAHPAVAWHGDRAAVGDSGVRRNDGVARRNDGVARRNDGGRRSDGGLTPMQLDRAVGVVLASAAGDALGSQYEFGSGLHDDQLPAFGVRGVRARAG